MINKASTTTPTQNNGGFFNVLRKPFFGGAAPAPKTRQVICKDTISTSDKEGVIRLYEALVPGDKERTVNVTMIYEEGLPVFEQVLGTDDFKKLKKYFGIDMKTSKKFQREQEQEVNMILERLRTVENAQYYINGYKTLLEKIAAKLHGAPEGMSTLEKAKIVRMYYTIFVGYYYFAHDFVRVFRGGRYIIDIDYQRALKNNFRYFYPEELFIVNGVLIEMCPDDALLYEEIMFELSKLDKKILKEVLQFAELKFDDENHLISTNAAPKWQTFSNIRTIKNKVHQEVGVYPMEIFACTNKMQEAYFDDLYQLYKVLRVTPLNEFKSFTKKEQYIEGARIVEKDRQYYELGDGMNVSGQVEIDRFIRMFEYMCDHDVVLKSSDGRECHMKTYMAAFTFMHAMKYVDITIDVFREFELAEIVINQDKDGALIEYIQKKISANDLRTRLGIDDEFEKNVFGIEKIETPEQIASKFAIENGYAVSQDEINEELIKNVVLPGNEELFAKYAAGEIDDVTLKSKIGFQEEFAEMYFDLRKVNMDSIESKLQGLKKSLAKKGEMRKYALTISLYCFLVEQQVPCGPKNKAPKRNKGLKPSNLKALIAA